MAGLRIGIHGIPGTEFQALWGKIESLEKAVISAFRTAFPDIHWVIEEMVGEGEKVFSRFTWHGTHRGEFFGVPATGKQIKVKGTVVDQVVAGRMAESRILMDGLSMMRQLGVIPE